MTYRTDTDALREQLEQIDRELQQIAEQTRLADELRRRQDELRHERADVESRLRARSLPLLESVRIAAPCNASWDDMVGDERVRFCGQCAKNVYNLSAMTRQAAESLIARTEGRICARMYRRADGTVLTADCPVGVRRRRRRRLALAAVVGTGAVAAAASSLCTMGRPVAMQGEIVATPYATPPTPTGSASAAATADDR